MPNKIKKQKNENGFTLIEILAAITILGILTTIAIVSVTKIIENGKKKHYVTAEANMVMAGQSYVQQNRSALPKAIGQKKQIPMTMLVSKKYIQPVTDYNEKACNMAESYVQVFKYSQSDYSYVAYLKCPDYNSDEIIKNQTPEISAEIIYNESNSTSNASIGITANDKLMSYSYIIYRNGKEVKNTGSVAVNNFAATKQLTFSLEDYTPGDIKIFVSATNTYGNTKTQIVTKGLPDTKNPVCRYLNPDDQADKEWTNSNRTIAIACDDGETGSGCKKTTYTKTFSSTTDYGTITIEDKEGNTTECSVSVFVDKDRPTCTNAGDSRSWTSEDRTITWGCSDIGSGCHASYSGSSQTFNTSTQTENISEYIIKDNAGNTATCSARRANVYVDKTAPTITSIYNPTNGTATATAFALTLNGRDSHSGIAKWRYKYASSTDWTDYSSSNTNTFTTPNFSDARNENVYISACDNVGNCSEEQSTLIYKVTNLCSETEEYYWTDWSWSECTEPCGGGTQYESRTAYLRSAYDHSTYCASVTQYQNENTACNTASCGEDINGPRYDGCDIYYITTCDSTTCNYTSKNGNAETGTIAKDELSAERSPSCNKSCPAASLLFGTSKGSHAGNYGSWVSSNASWGKWCSANGTKCSPSGGYQRICIHESCYGMTPAEIKTAWGCKYSNYWCSCN